MCNACYDCLGVCLLCYACRRNHETPLDPIARPIDPSRVPYQNLAHLWTARGGIGTDYPVGDDELKALQKPTTPSKRPPLPDVVSVHDACALLQRRPVEPQQQTEARRRILNIFTEPSPPLQPDIFIKAATDLDLLLFNGVLRGHITITWKTIPLSHGVLVRGTCQTLFARTRFRRMRIALNKTLFHEGARWEVLGTLVHEMLHAYLAIVLGPWESSRYEHGARFARAADALVENLGVDAFTARHISSGADA